MFYSCSFISIGQITDLSDGLADKWEFIGLAVEDPGYHVWGSSPIWGEDGKVHIFAARYTNKIGFVPGWKTHSEIAHYVADKPEGPFKFSDLVLAPTGKRTWDKMGIHNPNIKKSNGKYILTYISNNGLEHMGGNQRIGMATSTSLYGPWEKAGRDGMILQPPSNKDYWNYNSGNGVNNPAFLPHPKGGYFLYYKTSKNKISTMGLAIAENIEGPYVQLPIPITKNKTIIEDGYAFHYNNKFYLMTTDNHGMIERGGGLLWSSDDGINFGSPIQAFHLASHYLGGTSKISKKAKMHYGSERRFKFERPQLLLDKNGAPTHLYVPSGLNIYEGSSTVSYVLKLKK